MLQASLHWRVDVELTHRRIADRAGAFERRRADASARSLVIPLDAGHETARLPIEPGFSTAHQAVDVGVVLGDGPQEGAVRAELPIGVGTPGAIADIAA